MKQTLRVVFFAGTLVFVTTSYNNCGKLLGVDKEVKFSYLSETQVFDEESRSLNSEATWLDGESFDEGMSQVNQMDNGAQNQANNNDNGAGNNGNGDNGAGNGGSGDNGGGPTSDEDGGVIDKFDPNDPGNIGITIPMPTNPSALGVDEALNPNMALAKMRACIQSSGEGGFQFLRDDQKTYSSCDICEVIDRENGRCLIRVRLPDPPPRAVAAGDGNRNAMSNDDDDDDRGSGDPLIIDVGNASLESVAKGFLKRLSLSAQENGISFDLFGKRAKPAAHTKVKISWTDNPRYMYLVLPNRNGQVLGVNEMFGDSTLGPDGKYSLDGFHALSKYDGRDLRGRLVSHADKMITKDDRVFSHLRLWADTNRNGQSEPDELKTLDEVGIVLIDLKYDSSFYEKDVHGNEAIFKSVAKFANGKLGMVFDLWFKVKEEKEPQATTLRAPASTF